jgi:two-component system CheB/CheR fusion protein
MAHILMVEDDKQVNELLCGAIHRRGHITDCVQTRREAEARLGPESYGFVVSDIRLPDGSGYDVAATAQKFGIKTVLISGHPEDREALQTVSAVFLLKPFRISELQQTIDDLPPKKWTGLGRHSLDLGRGGVTESGVQAVGIVEAFDVMEQVTAGLGAGGVNPVVNPLGFEGVKEAFHRCVVEAVALAAHRRRNSISGERQPVGLGGVLDATSE